jgi:hypothetical protein
MQALTFPEVTQSSSVVSRPSPLTGAGWRGDFCHAEEIFDPGFPVHQGRPDGRDSESVTGSERLLPEIEQTMSGFGDITIAVGIGPIVDGDLIAASWITGAT